jgi:glycosyltransferase involved in cell wall biosynthesis
MKLLVISHKEVWPSAASPIGWATDGGFVFHMAAIGSLFEEVQIMVPVVEPRRQGEVLFKDAMINIDPIHQDFAKGKRRKLLILWWAIINFASLRKKIKDVDLVHIPVPSDLGTIGMYMALWLKKPLFIRHCGNWDNQRTMAEKLWLNFMEKHAGKNVLALATGGKVQAPSELNPNIQWIFSTSLLQSEIEDNIPRIYEDGQAFRLITVSRQVQAKGTSICIQALALLRSENVQLDVVGDGPDLPAFKRLAEDLGMLERVKFYGKLNHAAVLKVLKQAHLFCYPTKASEGFPKVVLEAMACGLPVISTPVSVLPSLVYSSGAGVIIEAAESELLADAVRKMIYENQVFEDCSKNALKEAAKYTLENWSLFIADRLNATFNWNLSPLRPIEK